MFFILLLNGDFCHVLHVTLCGMVEFQCLGFLPFVITDFNTILSTIRDWLQSDRMIHMVSRSVSPILLLFCRSPSSQSSFVFHEMKLIALMLFGMRLLQ